MKKLIALLLALTMVFALAACSKKPAEGTTAATDGATTPAADAEATYTYNTALTVFPTNWNPHTNQTDTDSEILDYVTAGLYRFDYNETEDGYALVPGMAVDYPEDVTADYIGQYGLEEGAENQAWKVTLRDDLKWEDGTPITAHDYEESYKRLLAPEAQNYRADGTYTGNMVIHNAENYLKSNQTVKQANSADGSTVAYNFADLVKGEDGTYATAEGCKVYFGLNEGYAWMQGNSLADYQGAGYIPEEGCWDVLSAAADEDGFVPVTDETIAALYSFTGSDTWGNESQDDLAYYVSYDFTYGETPWEEVGVFALSDNELVYVIDKPLSGFYLYYSLTDSYLVKTDLYDSLATVTDGVYTNTYGTSAETTVSFGPYKLTTFQADKQFVLERNENFYGLTDGKYQTTTWVVDFVPEASTRLELFLQGKLDSYGLSKEDMETYSLSDYCYYATGDSTFAMVFNPDKAALEQTQASAGTGINKTIITIPEFRMAMSFALDRSAFCLATSPTNGPAFGLYSNLIISDPDNGTAYRTTDVAKQVLADFWGVSEDYGEGKMYADIDEAVDSITGYNLTKAQELFNTAYDKAIEQGLMTENDKVEIKIGTPNNTTAFYNNGYEFLVNNYTEAVKGTKLEGKLTFSRDDTLGNGFGDALKNNQVDMLFGVGWTGSALDPYSLMEAYISPSYQYDDSTDFTAIMMTVAIDGVEYTASVADWYDVMMGNPTTITAADGSTMEYSCGYTDGDPETRLEILGEMEGVVLMNYNFIPIMDASTAQLRGQQVEFHTEEYIFGMGFGGVEYLTYDYTDAEWDAYVASSNNELDYT